MLDLGSSSSIEDLLQRRWDKTELVDKENYDIGMSDSSEKGKAKDQSRDKERRVD